MTPKSIKEFVFDPQKLHITLPLALVVSAWCLIWYVSAIVSEMRGVVTTNTIDIAALKTAQQLDVQSWIETRERLVRLETKQDSMQSSLNEIQSDIRYVISELKKK